MFDFYICLFLFRFFAGRIGERLMSRIKKAGNVWNAERLMNRKERQGIVTEEDGWYLKRHYCRNGGIKGSRVGYGGKSAEWKKAVTGGVMWEAVGAGNGGITELREAASAGAGTRKIRRAGAVAGCDGGFQICAFIVLSLLLHSFYHCGVTIL